MNWQDRIGVNPSVRSGTSCIKRSEFTVYGILELSLPRSRSGMLSRGPMALITGWHWAVVQPQASLQRGASPIGVDLTEHAKAVRQLAR